jgi:hypothetical protein
VCTDGQPFDLFLKNKFKKLKSERRFISVCTNGQLFDRIQPVLHMALIYSKWGRLLSVNWTSIIVENSFFFKQVTKSKGRILFPHFRDSDSFNENA